MKKIALILAMCMLLGCAGCSAAPQVQDTSCIQNAVRREISEQYRRNLASLDLEQTSAPLVLGQMWEESREMLMEETVAVPLVMEMASRESNPIALFLELVRRRVYEKEEQREGFPVEVTYMKGLHRERFFDTIPEAEPMVFGEEPIWDELFTQSLRMSASVEDDVPLESALLDQIENVSGLDIAYSDTDDCAYHYIVGYDQEYAWVMAAYYRESAVELQFLWLTYKEWGYAGCSTGMESARNEWSVQTGALIGAMEKLIAGQSRLESTYPDGRDMYVHYTLPGSYSLGEWQVEITSSLYESNLSLNDNYYHCAELVNYRISR